MTLKFKITFKLGPTVIATVEGRDCPMEVLCVGDVTERIIETEQYLERLTGLRVHIETGDEMSLKDGRYNILGTAIKIYRGRVVMGYHEHFCSRCSKHNGWWRCRDKQCVKPMLAPCKKHQEKQAEQGNKS